MALICAIPRVLTPAELSEAELMDLKGTQEGGGGRKVHASTRL